MALHIIHTINSIWRSSGLTEAVLHSVNACASEGGVGATLIAWHGDDDIAVGRFLPDVTVILLNRSGGFVQNLQSFRKVLMAQVCEADKGNCQVLIHDHGLWVESNIAAYLVSRELNVPRVVSVHGMLTPWALSHGAFKKRLAWVLYQSRALQCTAMLHVTSLQEEREVLELLPSANVELIPLGSEKQVVITTCETKQALYLSRIHPVKGIDLLLEAWVGAAPPDWQLLVAGPDELGYADEMQRKVNESGMAGRIRLTGPLYGNEKSDVFAESSLFILPSRSENFGLVVAEALMAGLPVITTTATPWSDLEEHQCGWVVAPNVGALTTAIKNATGLPSEVLGKMGRRGHEWMIKDFTWSKVGKRLIECYRRITE